MSKEALLSEETLRKLASHKVTFRYSVRVHALCYVSINGLLFLLNLLFSLGQWWVVFPTFGWLIGLALHITAYIGWVKGIAYGRRAILFHFVGYIFTILLLLLTNYTMSGTLDWIIYPVVGWGCGLFLHIFFYYLLTKTSSAEGEEGISRKERAIEKEMEKLRKKLGQ